MNIYQHYKGGLYALIGIAKHNTKLTVPRTFSISIRAFHTEKQKDIIIYSNGNYLISENEVLAVYQNLEGKIFARPCGMFFENVEEDSLIPRFKHIGKFKEWSLSDDFCISDIRNYHQEIEKEEFASDIIESINNTYK